MASTNNTNALATTSVFECPDCFTTLNCTKLKQYTSSDCFVGVCKNTDCPKKQEQYICDLCYKFTRSGNRVPGRPAGGKPIGVFAQRKYLLQHLRKNPLHSYVCSIQGVNNSELSQNEVVASDCYISNTGNGDNNNIGNDCITHDFNLAPFFVHEIDKPGKGAQFLTAQAYSLDIDQVTQEEVHFCFTFATLLCQLTQHQQKLLAEVMLQTSNSKEPNLSIFKNIRVPTSVTDFQDFFINGKNSILRNLPIPAVRTTSDGSHAYVKLVDVIANELAFNTSFQDFQFDAGIQLDDISNNKQEPTTSSTPAAYRLFCELSQENSNFDGNEDNNNTEFTMYLWLKEWRDDFDPNNIKSSRNNVWLNTFTICPPTGEKKGRNTYFMAISRKGEDHTEVEKLFTDELEQFTEAGIRFYHGGLKKVIKVKLGKLLTCIDRPERTSMFRCGDHNGTYSANWGYAGSVDATCSYNHLPSCYHCRGQRLKSLTVAEHNKCSKNSNTSNDSNPYEHTLCSNNVNYYGSRLTGCEHNMCSDWDMMDQKFKFPVPKNYPTTYDTREGAPPPPIGRDISISNASKELNTVKLSTTWLKQVVSFAHHNAKTCVPNTSRRYWTKGNTLEYLRTCSISAKYSEQVHDSALSGDDVPPIPPTWKDRDGFLKCHYAAMHMLFLGHTKSNYDMTSEWLKKHDIKSTFGKQVNVYLDKVCHLRINKYFSSHKLSTTSWGTGNWVSENYVFWARTQKFWFVLPSIMQSSNYNQRNPNYASDLQMLHRFVLSSHVAFSLLMSMNRSIANLMDAIKLYMDAMAEMDRWLKNSTPNHVDKHDVTVCENSQRKRRKHNEHQLTDFVSIAAQTNATEVFQTDESQQQECTKQLSTYQTYNKNKTKMKTTSMKTTYNFTKSNSLGILDAAESHHFHGPAMLHWEGSFAGERKIQEVKPLLSIKRENVQWQNITLTRLYQLETIKKILTKLPIKKNVTDTRSREIEGLLKIYGTLAALEDALAKSEPLSGLVCDDNSVWLACRPTGTGTRSSVELHELVFDDNDGTHVANLCWMAPIFRNGKVKEFASMQEVTDFSKQFLLLLPRMCADNGAFMNQYYVIGHEWTERNSFGKFEKGNYGTATCFEDWITNSATCNTTKYD